LARVAALNLANMELQHTAIAGPRPTAEQLDRFGWLYDVAGADEHIASRAWRARGRLAAARGDADAARADYAKAASTSGADAITLFEFGRALLAAGDRGPAVAVFRRVPNSEQFFLRRAAAASATAPDAALDDYRIAVEIRPESPVVQETWGQAQVHVAHDYAAGVASYRKAAALGLSHPYLTVEIGHAQQMAGAYDDALRTLEGSDDPLAHGIRGDIFLSRSRTEDAIREYARAVALQPRNPWFLTGYGSALCAAGKPAEAEARWKQALEVAPGFAAVGAGRCVSATPGRDR
jgi:Tfp pilus assembly protein PilF